MAGREAELDVIDRALVEALDGHGQLVLVAGEPGIGKSRLAQAAAERATERGLTVARGYAVDDAGAPPLWPFLRLVRDVPALASVLRRDVAVGDAGERFQLFVEVADLLTALAREAPALLVLEDLQWADRTSLLLLQHLVRELGSARIVVLGTTRVARTGPAAALLPAIVAGADATQVVLDGLTVTEVVRLLAAAGGLDDGDGLAAALRARTNGNPLMLMLLIDALSPADGRDADPAALDGLLRERADLRQLVTAQVRDLPPSTRELLDLSSLLGEHVELRRLAALAGVPGAQIVTALEPAVLAGVMVERREAGAAFSFTHALIRDAVAADLTAAQRGALHARIAQVLEAEDSPAAGLIASHWRRAAAPEATAKCLHWARAAAREAVRMLAFDEASAFATLAVETGRARGSGPDVMAELVLELAEAQFAAGDIAACLVSCDEASALAEAAGRADLMAAAGLVVQGLGSGESNRLVLRLCRRALEVGGHQPIPRARLLAQLAAATAEHEGGPEAAELAASALRVAEDSGDIRAILEAIAARHLSIAVPGTVDERLRLGRRAVELGTRARIPLSAMWGHLWRADAAFQLGDLAEVDRHADEIDRIATTRRSGLARWHHHRLLATKAALLGDFGAALTHNEDARALADRMGDWSLIGLYYAFGFTVALIRGDPSALPPDWEEAIRRGPGMPLVQASIPAAWALRGDRAAAAAAFAQFRDVPMTMPVGVRWAPTLVTISQTAVMLEDAEVAEAIYQAVLPMAGYYSGDGSGALFSNGANAGWIADLARVAGHRDDATELYRTAIGMNDRIGARPYAALSRLGLAATLHAELAAGQKASPRDLARAGALVDDAAAEFRRLDMPGPSARAAALREDLRALERTTNPLSVREREVATLVAEGLSNREVADRLFLSERTVETHVRSILQKLGFSSRTQVATWAVRSLTH